MKRSLLKKAKKAFRRILNKMRRYNVNLTRAPRNEDFFYYMSEPADPEAFDGMELSENMKNLLSEEC